MLITPTPESEDEMAKAKQSVSSSFISLPSDMDKARARLDKLPKDHEYTLDELDWLEDARRTANRLVSEIDLIYEEIYGRPEHKTS